MTPTERQLLEEIVLFRLAKFTHRDPTLITHHTRLKLHHPYAFSFANDRYAIRVATATKHKRDGVYIWDFDLRRPTGIKHPFNWFLLVGMLNGIPQKIFMIPVKETPSSHVRISVDGESKYQKYVI